MTLKFTGYCRQTSYTDSTAFANVHTYYLHNACYSIVAGFSRFLISQDHISILPTFKCIALSTCSWRPGGLGRTSS